MGETTADRAALSFRENRTNAAYYALCGFAFIFMFVWALSDALNPSSQHSGRVHPGPLFLVAPIAAVFLPWVTGLACYRMLRAPTLVRIHAEGLELHTWGLIPWDDIEKVELVRFSLHSRRSEEIWLQFTIRNAKTYASRRGVLNKLIAGWSRRTKETIVFQEKRFRQPAWSIEEAIEAHRPPDMPKAPTP